MSQSNILLESGTNELEIVEFFIDEQGPDGTVYRGYYGVNVAKVLEIIRLPQITEMPEATHPCILGAFNLRARIVPLIDLSIWLDKQMAETSSPKVIVTEFNYVTNSFLVSGVNRIHRLSWEQVEPPGQHLEQFSDGSITGVVKFDDRILLLLDMERIVGELNPSLAMNVGDDYLQPDDANMTMRVVFADDSSMIRKTLSKGLAQAGFEVTVLNDGKQAWDHLLELKEKAGESPITDLVNIIISDIEMPVMDGHNLTKRIKNDPVLKELPVMLFSSLITEALRHKGESVGADDQIAKPDIQSLTRRTKELIESRQQINLDDVVQP